MQTRSSGSAPILAFFGLVALWGCGTESLQGPEKSQFVAVSGPAQILLPPCDANPLSGFSIRWTCDNLVVLVNGPTEFRSLIETSMTQWNDALDLDAVIHRPRFGWTTNPANAQVIVNVTSSSTGYCGNEGGLTSNRTINMFAGGCGTFGIVLTHEFAHTLGFDVHEFDDQAGVSTNCVFAIAQSGPEIGVLHSSFCQHEIEYIYQAYGQRQGGFVATAFWNHPIVTGLLTTPASISIDQGVSVNVNVSKLVFGNGQTQLADLGGTSLSWSVDPLGLASVTPTGGPTVEVTGSAVLQGPGVVKVTVANVSGMYLRSTALFVNKHQIPLTVTTPACTPGASPIVTAISVDQEPAITLPGSHSFTASVVGCVGAATYFWTFTPSLPGLPGLWIIDGSNPQTYNVPGGNYTLTVTVTPHNGFAFTRFVNVCTSPPGGGGGLFGQKGGGVGTNAVAGCGGGGGEPF